ncbi:MAG: amino acid adenylation domain-containing protein [Nostoc sp.]|uniref:amino acid adenylation domain-containing protein n=1 Tax=Nostoc sp. TaxID=1180 RepID=UPI002FF80D6D
MTTVEFLSLLQTKGVKIWIDSDQLGYRAPKGAMTADIKQELAKRKTEILTFLKQAKKSQQFASEPIIPVKRDGDLPLSFPQQRVWFLYQLDRQSPFYNENLQLRIIGALNVAALEQSINEIIRRHEALRTIFPTVDGFVVQRILPTLTVNIPVVNLEGLKKAEIEQIIIKEICQPFDLSKPPLLRVTLLRLESELYLLILTVHHIIIDGWSVGIFIKEVSALYQAFSTGSPTPLPELTVQYGDFTIWQRHWLTGEVLQTQLNYWRQQLKGIPTLLELPTCRPRPAIQNYRGAHLSIPLSVELSEGLLLLSKRAEVSLFMTLLAAFQTLLYRYTTNDDIVVGTPIANRNRREIKGLIGFFVNTLVLRTDFSGNPGFEQLLGRVREVTLGAYAHQDLPLEELLEALQPERSLSHSPLFQVMFTLENAPASCLDLHELTVSLLQLEIPTAKFDLTLSMENTLQGLIGVWEYNTDLFDAATIARMAGHFEILLSAIVANPQQPISELPLLTEAERQQLLVEWNNTQKEYPQDKCIHQLFEAQVELTPNAVAVVFEGKQLTYGELNVKANQLARYLQSLGVKPEVLVGICVERSLEMVVGLLGILKAGGAYVPLDPTYPYERLAFTIENVSMEVLLTSVQQIGKLPLSQAHIVCLDKNWKEIAHYSKSNFASRVASNNLAYVIYTSGSTGRSKGVPIEHQNTVALLTWAKEIFPDEDIAGVLASTSICFDLSVFELFVPLSRGGTVILAQNALSLPTLPAVNQVTLINTVPSAIAELLRLKAIPPGVRTINLAGESLQNQLVQQLYRQTNVQQVFNLYGPTEYTTYSTFSLVKKGDSFVTIGRPIENTQVYLLDANLMPVPIGISGELYISGAGLARGYLNRPDLTDEKFIPNPFNEKPGSRLYKTGDLVRYLPDGNIEFLSRMDDQVKIRGFRIELGEIETAISQHPAVKETVVIAREDIPSHKSLAAYIVDKQPLTSNDLRNFLKELLPDYMIPAAFIMLDALPLTPNGKIDRRALPAPDVSTLSRETAFIPPRTPTEKILATIWAEVLQLELVGIQDNFFELGGDSILSIQIVARCNQVGLKLAPKDLFGHQTIASLAQVVSNTEEIQAEQGFITGTVPLTPILHWFLSQKLSEPHHFNQSFIFEVSIDLKPELLKQAVQQLLVHHDALRLRLMAFGDNWQLLNAASVETEFFSVVDLSGIATIEQTSTIEAAAIKLQASLNLSSGSIVRVTLFNLGTDQPNRLLIVIHHLAIDGVSWRILLEDLATAYQQIERKEAIALPAKTTSFQDWAVRLTEYARSEKAVAELNHWLAQFDSDISPLPLDYPSVEAENTIADAAQISVSLNVEQTSALLKEVPRAYNTQINDVLLTALLQCFSQWTGKHSLLINLEGHGREELFEDVNLSRTVGWFTSTFPVLLKLDETDLPLKSLKLVKEQLRCIPQHGIGYGILRYLSSDRATRLKLQHLPTAEVSFNYLGQFDQMLSALPLLRLAKESSGSSVSLKNTRSHLLEVDGFVAQGKLQLTWTYNQKFHQKVTVERLAQSFIEALAALISHCLSSEVGGYTPSDFPSVELTQEELDALVESLAPPPGTKRKTQIESIYPLSPMQEGMLFHTLYAPDSGVYFVQSVFTLNGKVNVSAFERAWVKVVEAHSVLRTLFVWKDRQHPLQIVCQSVNLPWNNYDWRSLSSVEQQERLETFLQTERDSGFELDKAPLMRCTLIQVADNTYQFVWSFHHLLMDGWCLPIVLKEVFAFYEAFNRGENLYLDSPIPYRNYIAWLRQQDCRIASKFWQQTLSGFTAPTPLMVDKPVGNLSNSKQTYDEQHLKLSLTLTDAIKLLARSHHLTLNTLVQGAWALLLSRYSGESDVVFGATVSGRPPALPGVESMVGLFINTLPVRIQVPKDTELLPWLKQLQTQQFELLQYSYSSLVEIQGNSNVPRNLPLFESIVVFENYPEISSLLQSRESIEISNIRSFERTNYPLTVAVVSGLELSFGISYDTSRFDGSTVNRMMGHLQTILEGMTANPQQRISKLPLLTERERHQLLVEWNCSTIEYPQNKCIHQLFEAQVEQNPEAIAVVFENQQLTYNELNCRANQLAHHLQSLGVKPEVLVGICVERSLDMLVGILSILKAGGAYIPFDPTYPQERLGFMLEDAQIPILLTQQQLLDKFVAHHTHVICLDQDSPAKATVSIDNPDSNITSENIAYIIYTSGSTGKPKGVAIEHKSIVNYVLSIIDRLHIQAGSSFALVSTISADLGNTVLFPSLCTGGTLHILSWDRTVNSAAFTQYISENSIDYLKIVPSHLAALQNPANPQSALPRKGLILGGEASQSNWVSNLLATQSECKVYNHYGPTETTVGVLTYSVDKNLPATPTLPLGYPLNNTQIYILDTNLNPLPIGIPGEIYVGGIAVARGYINQADLTAERFITNPFNGSRLYKTGDLARYLPNGNIEFKGRIDNQVKIRGFRVELKDIETALCQHPDVESAAVISQQEQQNNKQLVAYVVSQQKRSPIISGMPRYKLPNNLYVAHLNKNETNYIYKEIFELQAYLRHGITVNEEDCIFDVGSNIGLFGLFMATICPQIQLYAFEPNPTVYKRLQANLSLYVPNAQSFNCGLSQAKTTAEFTFFPGFSMLSGFYANAKVEREVVKNFVSNQRNEDKSVVQDFLAQADEILEERFKAETFTAQLRTLSEIIKEQGIENIDLLKINVEKSELDVLRGIQEQDWGKIRQIVLEVDVQENIQPIISLLEKHGYEYFLEQDVVLYNTELCYIYAIRPSTRGKLAREQSSKAHIQQLPIFDDSLISSSELENFIKDKLPEYMMPNAFVFLSDLPLTDNGKINRQALPAPELYSEDKYVAPRTPIEEILVQIWAQVLEVEQVGIHDNFFELGGHSLLATQLLSRIRNIFKVELPLRELFATPTVAEFVQLIGQLQQQSLELTAPPILPRAENAELPLSFAQQRLWFLDQLQPESTFYNIPIALRLQGTLNTAALEQSLAEIIHRHEALRTNFIIVDGGQPTQIIQTQTSWTLSVVDLKHLSTTEQEIASQELAQQQPTQPFDLARDALVRATLVVLSETQHILLVCMHHIVSDGWSISVLLTELAALYNAYSQGQPSLQDATRTPLVPLPIQYADFALWQREWLQGDVLQNQLSYWQQQLKDAPALLSLPTDRSRPAVQTFAGAYQKFALSVELTQKLTKLSQKQGATLFMTLLAAFDTLLYRYTGQEDILVGSPIANRNRSEIEGLIGFFVNTLVLRTNVSGDRSFNELLAHVRDMTMDAYTHQDLPFEMLVEALQPERHLSHAPLFKLMFVLENKPMFQLELPGLTVSPLVVESATAKFDLTLGMENTPTGLVGVWEYNTDLFDASTIERMTGHFVTLLEGIVANPHKQISQLPLLTVTEQQQLLVEWNNTQVDYYQDKCIHQLFEEQVQRTPDAVAVVFGNQQLTYQQLNCRANQLAHYLQTLGIKPDVLVGLCVERSLEMMVGVLAILKAGGAYVPLDPDYPTERLSFMLEDAQVSVLLGQQKLVESLPRHHARVVCLDTDWEKIAQNSESNLTNVAVPNNLAYVIYTSGSTGKPKGVLVNHSNVVRLFEATNSWYHFNQDDVWTMFHSFAFDFSVWEIWGALLYGGRLVVVPYLVTRSPKFFYELLCQEKVTVLNQTPSAFRQLIQASPALGSDLKLRLVIFGGEALELWSLQPWFERYGDQMPQLVNMYGITETTVHVTYRPLSKADLNGTASVIGHPIPDLQVYVLDEYKQPVPIGVSGEMYVGGAGVARGYFNRPDLTQQRFISNPFSNNPQARLYKTGDKARYFPNGELEYLGRIDNQVKIRGFRIELGEIEALLASHPDVWENVVMVRDEPSNKRLVAYVVSKVEQSPKVAELRRFLKQKLPEYMVPSAFVQLEALPLTANGKVDRRALPIPDNSQTELEDNFVAPTTATEKTLAAIWAEVLGMQQIGINDNFFTLGGHSLIATQIISRIREAFEIEVPLRHLFEAPTIASLTEVIETAQKEGLQEQSDISMEFETLPPLVPIPRDTHIPLSFAQQAVWYFQQLYADSCAYNSPIALCFNGLLREEALEFSINEIIRRHSILRTTFTVLEEQPIQVIAPSLTLPLNIIDLQHLPEQEREVEAIRLSHQEALHHFDLTSGPLIKTTLLRLEPQKHWLIITMHHIITDGWSYSILLQELGTLYQAFVNGLPSPLPEVTIQYADFTLWQQKWLNEEVLEKQHSYWLQKLAHFPTKLDLLPTVQPQSTSISKRASCYSIVLPHSQVASIEALSRSQEMTIFSIILAALKILLYKLSGQTDIIILATTANRSTPEIEKMLGCFINNVLLRDKIDSFQTGLTFTQQVNQTVAEALANQEIPIEKATETIFSESEIELFRTISVSMIPQVRSQGQILEFEFVSIELEHELWDEKYLPLELYINSQTGDSKTIEIVGYYSTDLFTNETIDCLFSCYKEILHKLVEYPETKLSQF